MNTFVNMDEVYIHFSKQLEDADVCAPRGMEIKEVIGAAFELMNPRNRLIYLSERDSSLHFNIGEFLWYLRGSNSLDIIRYYSKMYSKFSDDQQTLYGAYGTRIFGAQNGVKSQWEALIELLTKDPDTRQAVISIHEPRDLSASSHDIPCTCTMQFLLRDGKLNCIVYMRSNDLYLGLPYDVFSFTMIQEVLAKRLNVKLGSYRHMVGSLHVYKQNYDQIAQCARSKSMDYVSMPPMPEYSEENFRKLLELEEQVRTLGSCDLSILRQLPHFWQQVIGVLRHKARRVNDAPEPELVIDCVAFQRKLKM